MAWEDHDQSRTGSSPPVPWSPGPDDASAGWGASEPGLWTAELPKWMATLNPGRTRREYEKAVRYFFDTPGVPQRLSDLSFDLLLAYRGALALRAAPHQEQQPVARATATTAGARIASAPAAALPGTAEEPAGDGDDRDAGSPAEARALAPATVNIRLTALRQFLIYCALFGAMGHLSPERIRGALRRLRVDRRRPYQVLAEPEWEQFLEAARLPVTASPRPARRADDAIDDDTAGQPEPVRPPRGPWGTPRAARQPRDHVVEQELADSQGETNTHERSIARATTPAPERTRVPLPRTRAGLTGERTAERDHALIALALASGLRAVELAALDVSDLSREYHAGAEEWWLVLPDAKTKGQRGGRTLPLAPTLVETLQAYLASTGRSWERASDRATPLFLSSVRSRRPASSAPAPGGARPGGRLTPNQIRRIVDRVETQWLALRGQSADLDEGELVGEARSISPHSLRHSTAIALLEGNERAGRPPASVEHVRGWLGHFDIRTTQGYLAHLEARQHRRPFALAPTDHATAVPTNQAGQLGGGDCTPTDSPSGDGASGSDA